MYKLVFLGNGGGGGLSRLASHQFVREMTIECVTDKECGFLEAAKSQGLDTAVLRASSGKEFSVLLRERFGSRSEVIYISFYNRLLAGRFVSENAGRIFNCHPALLPAFGGLRGFRDSFESSSAFMGCTLHAVDEGVDSGTIMIQAALPLDRSLGYEVNRHKVFLAQYYTALQFIKWVHEGRLKIDAPDSFTVSGISFNPSMFSPNLDKDFFSFAGIENELEHETSK